jgi:aerobic carbon-monoxide dehydrogenase medium subunit
VIPAPFDYVRASSVEDAVTALAADPEAKVLAGGHSLLPAMKLRVARPSTLIDIGRIEGLSSIRADGDEVVIGALARHHDVATSELLHERVPIASFAAAQIGDPAVRHVGTIGGSIAHGDPAGDMPCVLLALDASVVARGPGGSVRSIPVRTFFTGLFETALAPDEVLTEIRIPRPRDGWSFVKFNRRAQDWALVGVSAIRTDAGVRVALTNMGLTPLRATGVEEEIGRGAGPVAAAARADEGTAPPDDAFASADYRRALVQVLVERALREALA